MTYPTLSKDSARDLLDRHRRDEVVVDEFEKTTVFRDGGSFEMERAIEVSAVLWELAKTKMERKHLGGFDFDRQAASIVHERLRLSPLVAGDADFWRWLTFAANGELMELVDIRYERDPTLGGPREIYYGLGNIKKGMYAQLWLRADSVVDDTLDDPYELTRRGNVDVWDSHIIDVDFGSVHQFARAFIRWVFPTEEDQTLELDDYRILAREITRRNASMTLEILDQDDCTVFIEEVWGERDAWKPYYDSH